MDKEYIEIPNAENTDNLNIIFALDENSFSKYNLEFDVVGIKTIKESCKFLINLIDKDISTYKKDVKKIEDLEIILINSIIQHRNDLKKKLTEKKSK